MTASVATSARRSTATFGDIATGSGTPSPGPAVTLTTPASGRVLVIVTATIGPITGFSGFMSFESTGTGANVSPSIPLSLIGIDQGVRASATYLVTVAGSQSKTFTAKYLAGDGIMAFSERVITVIPMP